MTATEHTEQDAKFKPDDGVTRQLLRITTAGSVDDGKSTLIGRLLHDTDSLPLDHLEAVTDEEGVADLAALSDGLRAEREQGITIDVAYRFFSTATRSYILADTPGHERYTRNMFTGASNAHVAILLVDARAGVLRQTRRHARIAKLLGIKHFVAAVNKIDLVDFDQNRFTEVESELQKLSTRLGGLDISVIPIAAKLGDNVVHSSENTPWYNGPTLLDYLEDVELAAPHAEPNRLRLPIQWVSRPTDNQRRRYTGRLAAGTLSVGDPIISLPAGTESTVTALDTLDDERTTGVAPLSVSLSWLTTSTSGEAMCWSAVPRTRRCRCWRANSTRTCAGSSTLRYGPATDWLSSRPLPPFGRRSRNCTRASIPRRSTKSTIRSSWSSTTSAP